MDEGSHLINSPRFYQVLLETPIETIQSPGQFLASLHANLDGDGKLGFHAWQEIRVGVQVTFVMLPFDELVTVAALVASGKDPTLAVKLVCQSMAIGFPTDCSSRDRDFPDLWSTPCWYAGCYQIRDGRTWDVFVDFDADDEILLGGDATRYRIATMSRPEADDPSVAALLLRESVRRIADRS